MANRLATALATLGLMASATLAAQAQSLDELYAKAKPEGAFRLLCRRANRALGGSDKSF